MQIPPPADWQDFQRLCCDLWKLIWRDPNAQEYGRLGQRQNGVDIYGRIAGGSIIGGVQCKDKDALAAKTLTIKELRQEVKKAKAFQPPLAEYVVAFTGPRDKALQDEATRISVMHQRYNKFRVIVWSWEDIISELGSHPELLKKHYGVISDSTTEISTVVKEVVGEAAENIITIGKAIGEKVSGEVTQGLSGINQALSRLNGPEIDTDLEHIKQLIETHKPKTCLRYLQLVIEKKFDRLSDIGKYKLLANRATCFLQLDRTVDASQDFIGALHFNKESGKALVNAALGYFLIQNAAEGLKLIQAALQKNPMNVEAWTLKVQFDRDSPSEELIASIPQALLDKTEINWAIGCRLQAFGGLPEAEEYLTTAFRKDTDNRIELAIQYASIKLENCIEANIPIGGHANTPDVQSVLEDCEGILSKALDRMIDSDITPMRIQAATNRGVIFRLLGQKEKAIKDFDQVLEWDPREFQAAKQKAVLLVEADQYDAAIATLRPFSSTDGNYIAKMLVADALRLRGKTNEALDVIGNCAMWDLPERDKIHALQLTVECYVELEDMTNALKSIEAMKSLFPQSLVPFVTASMVERHFGKPEEAAQNALIAKTLPIEEKGFFDQLRLGDELYHLGYFADAMDVYARIAVPSRNDALTRQYILACYRADQNDKALKLSLDLVDHFPNVQYAAEIASAISEAIGDLTASIRTLQRYLNGQPNDDHMRLRLATVLTRAGRKVEAEAEIDKVSGEDTLSPYETVLYAQLLSSRGEVEHAIRYLYESHRKQSNDPDIEMCYIGTVLGRGEKIPLLEDPDVVDVDSVVTVGTGNDQEYYILEDRPGADFRRREVDVRSPIAQTLLGRRVGDNVDLERNPIQPKTSTVRSIRSKYGLALNEMMKSHARRFPDRQDFVSISTPTDGQGEIDATAFKEQIKNALPDDRHRRLLTNLYREGKLTIGGVAGLAQRDLLSTTIFLAAQKEVGVFASTGAADDYANGSAALERRSGLVVDPIAIIVMEYLGLRDRLLGDYGPFFVAQSALDEFNRTKALRGIGGTQAEMSIFKQNGEVYRQETSAEDKAKQIQILHNVIDWINASCTIVPVKAALALGRSEKERLDKVFHPAIYDSVLIAQETRTPLFTDDGRTRSFAASQHGVSGVWTHCIIRHALSKGSMTEEEFNQHSISLLSLNMHHIPVSSNLLMEAAKKSGWLADYPLLSVLFNLAGLRCSEASAIVVAGEFIYSLWIYPLEVIHRNSLIMAVFDAVATGRNRDTAVKNLEERISQQFRLWPQAGEAIVGLLKVWYKTKLFASIA